MAIYKVAYSDMTCLTFDVTQDLQELVDDSDQIHCVERVSPLSFRVRYKHRSAVIYYYESKHVCDNKFFTAWSLLCEENQVERVL